jgi:cyclic pyranopterin phosphate synthase
MRKPLHVDARGRVRMIDVGGKRATRRTARAEGRVELSPAAFRALSTGRLAKGDALAAARLAGILAAKRTSEIIPLCHPLPVDAVSVDVALDEKRREAVVTASTAIRGRTGVEMEALVAVAAACLTVYDMVKGIDRGCRIREIALLEKSGGASGRFRRPSARTMGS